MHCHKFLSVALGTIFSSSLFVSIPIIAQDEKQFISLEEVVVTAERRTGDLQSVPVAVSAFTESEMERRQVDSTVDVVRNVPNLVGSNNVGLSSATSFFLRGVGQDDSLSTQDPAVGTYVDGVYIARQIANNSLLYDIERIEVLRGPQGTLYGRNTSGGAVSIITRKPDEEFDGAVSASIGNYDSLSVRGRFNVPLAENVFLNASAFTAEQDEGFQENITLGTRAYDASSSGLRAALRILPNDDVDIVLTAEIAEQEDAGVTGSNALGANADQLFIVQSGLEGSFNEIDQTALSANVSWSIGGSTWNSITGYRDLEQKYRIDFSDNPVPAFVIDQDGSHEQFSQEFNGSGSIGNLDWVAGVFYMEETNENIRRDELFLFGGAVAGDFVADLDNDTESFAVFGQGTYHLNERLSLVLGGRWTREDKTLDIVQSVDIGGGVLVPLWSTADLDALGTETAPEFKQFTPKFGLNYDLAEDHFIYASYTEGFKSGGWNARATDPADFNLIESETAEAFEVGFKSEFLDNRLRLNGAYFYNTYKDFIVTALNPVTGGFVTINAAEAEISGLELELSAKASEGLDIYGNVGLMSNEYKELGDNVLFDINNEIKRTPDLSAQIGFNYLMPMSAGDALIISADYSYQDEYYGGVSNTAEELSEATKLLHASIAYEVNDGAWRITASCENCTDQEYHHSTLDFSALGFSTQFPGIPRVYSLSLDMSF